MSGPIYLDNNATTPVDARVAEAILPFLTGHFGNPSSTHAYGEPARTAVARAREQVAALLGCGDDEVVFTSGGSESDVLAIRGAALGRGDGRRQVITQATEHPAVLAACDALRRLHGFEITVLPVDEHGLVDPTEAEAAISDRTALVTIMHANNETGTIQPIRRLAALAHARGALFHTDAAQSIGKIVVDVADLDVDLLTVAGHKAYAPKGVGALYVRSGVTLEPLVHGGGQERGLRGGTENVALIAGLGEAARLCAAALPRETERLRALRDRLWTRLSEAVPAELNGHPIERLPNTLNVSLTGTVGADVLAGAPEVAAATGSACHEGVDEPSPVLAAMGLPVERAKAALRLTVGRTTTAADVDAAAVALLRSATR
ncbi:cysteine desulfurase family protein [Labedaea rhizosphaerae]|uniref:cysteine desulfurase n=1 Tax=Labedaea rhizosphaerae TaxID=598644 RepID=A0A4R6RVQ9_LABRH|nr:cysteine desulfurase family protein [Labedaea rhizosphaerae]TDP91082.1 cysteine desulfurase [Labedaea rhizosphaerae]